MLVQIQQAFTEGDGHSPRHIPIHRAGPNKTDARAVLCHNQTYRFDAMRHLILMLILMAGPAQHTHAQTHIFGTVTDTEGRPLPYVSVYLMGTTEGTATTPAGRFAFDSRLTGSQVLKASLLGFESRERSVTLVVDTVRMAFVLPETRVELGEATVTASAYTTGELETVALSSLEVVTTPGAAADIFMAIKTFPGLAMVDEGGGLYVRGGDVSETVVLLDQATVAHPYRYESPTGGVFGSIPPLMIGRTFFSSGGFSAKYGNALSGVLAMESLDMPVRPSYQLNLGLAAASIGLNVPLRDGTWGIRFTGNRMPQVPCFA